MSDEGDEDRHAEARAKAADAVRECVGMTVEVMREAIELSLATGVTDDEILLDLRAQFMARGKRRWDEDDVEGIYADYSNYCAVLISLVEAYERIVELEGFMELHTLLLKLIDTDRISMEVRDKRKDDDG